MQSPVSRVMNARNNTGTPGVSTEANRDPGAGRYFSLPKYNTGDQYRAEQIFLFAGTLQAA